mgnify:CR=1 FL=1
MPQIELSTTRGLVQRSGLGLVDAAVQIDAGAVDLTTATAEEKGAVVHSVTAGGAVDFKLHGTDQGAVKGQIKIILSQDAENVQLLNAAGVAVTPATVLTNAGDMAICVYNGSTWVCGNSIG